jgi:short-chain fatty acids transporter
LLETIAMTAVTDRPRPTRGFIALTVALFERWMPDPFVIAIGLTFATALAALALAPKGSPSVIATAWYAGVFDILAFAFQMVMILVTGHALAHAPPVIRAIRWLVSLAKTPNQAVVLTFLVSAAASFLNWGFGLVVAAMLSREVAARMKVDFGWIVAAAYSGWVVWATGFSSSIALTQASAGNKLNIIEKLTGKVTPFGDMVFQPYNLVATLLIVALVPIAFVLARPRDDDAITWTPDPPVPEASSSGRGVGESAARRTERSPLWSWLFAFAGLASLAYAWASKGPAVDINAVIWIFLMLGIALHASPVAYVAAVNNAAKQVGSMILQYPIYGGIMGILNATGLAGVISKAFVAIASAHTLPFWSYVCSLFITFLVPSGGGHWAVQGPFVIPAAIQLGASPASTAMAVAAGENVAYMLQPFFALPVVAIAGIGIQRVMGYTVVTFLVACPIWAAATLLLM